MAPAKGPFAEFKGKQKLTGREVNLLRRWLNEGKIPLSQVRSGGYALTPDQVEKGRKWLMNLWVTPKGVERKNNPFGYREQAILETFQTIRLAQFTDISRYRAPFPIIVPVYEVVGKDDSFMYYLSGGKINIVG